PAGRPEPAGHSMPQQLHSDGGVPHQARRSAAAGALGSPLTASAPGVPGQRSAP
ncbi:AraC family transcriptional regulator, partial [Streptomyces sp. ETH9427]